jgi:hypothetical protein
MTPPRLATWFLLTFAVGPDVDAIAGDLAEQYPTRSAGWYWRQTGYAIVASATQHLRRHWVVALGTVWVGGLVMGLAGFAGRRLAYWVLPLVLPAPISPSSWPVMLLTLAAPATVAGWVLGRMHRLYGVPFAFAFAVVAVHVAVLPRLVFLARNSLEHERFQPYLVEYVSGIPMVALLIGCGALGGCLLAQASTRVAIRARRV